MEPPFNVIIVGMTACGKTRYLLEMLEKEHLGVFDYVVLVCPTFSNPTQSGCLARKTTVLYQSTVSKSKLTKF